MNMYKTLFEVLKLYNIEYIQNGDLVNVRMNTFTISFLPMYISDDKVRVYMKFRNTEYAIRTINFDNLDEYVSSLKTYLEQLIVLDRKMHFFFGVIQ